MPFFGDCIHPSVEGQTALFRAISCRKIRYQSRSTSFFRIMLVCGPNLIDLQHAVKIRFITESNASRIKRLCESLCSQRLCVSFPFFIWTRVIPFHQYDCVSFECFFTVIARLRSGLIFFRLEKARLLRRLAMTVLFAFFL